VEPEEEVEVVDLIEEDGEDEDVTH